MKKIEVKNKGEGELNKMLSEKREALRLFRFGSAGTRVKDIKKGRNIRKDIARVLTEISRQSIVDSR